MDSKSNWPSINRLFLMKVPSRIGILGSPNLAFYSLHKPKSYPPPPLLDDKFSPCNKDPVFGRYAGWTICICSPGMEMHDVEDELDI